MNRSYSLDAVRGLAIIGMVLSETISRTLPAWMYHAQEGPRTNFNYDPTIVGITWVDLVFPFFIFAMGAATPFALNSRLKKGESIWSLFGSLVKRYLVLILFAIGIFYCSPFKLEGDSRFFYAILAFLIFFISFVRLPNLSLPKNNRLNIVGYFLLILLVGWNVYNEPEVFNTGFRFSNNDIILVIMAHIALFGSLIWAFTRTSTSARLLVMFFIFAFRQTAEIDTSWNALIWNFTPEQLMPQEWISRLYENGDWLFELDHLNYLFVFIPGTIAGDLLVRYNRFGFLATDLRAKRKWSAFALIMVLFLVINIIDLYLRKIEINLISNVVLALAGFYILRKPQTFQEKCYHKQYTWAVVWLFLGLTFEAYEGGVHKDTATISYFFISSGLAITTLLFFSIIINLYDQRKSIRYIIECGQNPLLAYVAGAFLIFPLSSITGFYKLIKLMPELLLTTGSFEGAVVTGGVIFVTVFSVRKRWFWKI